MPGTSPLQLYSFPTTSDQASPASIQTLAQAVEKQVVAIFPDAATRDSRWTTATGLANGAMCFITSTGELQLRAGGAWVVIGGRAAPFATAAGTGTYSLAATGSTTVAVTFPAGRFSIAPIVIANGESAGAGSYQITFRILSVSTTGCSVACTMYNNSAVTVTGEFFGWFAHQMTSAAAAG
jgi:hypothetical protein